ncbi:MAG: M48 family metallopeptidase [Pseudohongiellaceae bacterium]
MPALRLPVCKIGPAILFCVLGACATSPTERRQVVLYSEQEMAQMGTQAYQQMRQEMPVSSNRRHNEFVQCVTGYIVAALSEEEKGEYVWEATLFEDSSANAFALPGGKMGVFTGLLDVAENQHQLGAVIAHEVGHVLARHSNERASRSTLRDVGFVVAQVLGVPGSTMGAVDLATELGLMRPFGRAQESEADTVGVMLMARAGFDPEQSIKLWVNMNSQGGSRPPEFISTHPSPETRIGDLRRLMEPAQALRESAMARGFVPDCER